METVKIVTTEAIRNEVCRMADVDPHIPPHHRPQQGIVADPQGFARFMVCATMLLGSADATMLALVVDEWALDGEDHLELDEDRVYTFPGWEVI